MCKILMLVRKAAVNLKVHYVPKGLLLLERVVAVRSVYTALVRRVVGVFSQRYPMRISANSRRFKIGWLENDGF